MSGIMTSSEPLMNEVQKFERGGTVRERAISGEGALDQLASSSRTPMDFRALDRNLGARVHAAHDAVQGSIFRFLGNTFRVIRDKIFHEESGVEIEEPSLKREILTQGERIAEEDMAMAVPVPQGQPRVFTQPVPETMDPVTTPEFTADPRLGMGELMRGTGMPMADGFEPTAPAAPTMEDIIAARSIAENQGGPMGEAAAALAGMTSQDSVMFPGELSKAFVPQQDVQTEGFIPPTIGATELNTPAVRNAMAQPPSAGLATELMLAAQQGPAPDPNDEILAQARALLSDEANARIDSGDTQAIIANALGPDSPLLDANQGDALASEELAAAAENEGFVPVTLNQGTMGMSVFDYNPETGAIRPRGGNAEIMLGGGSRAEANVQKMVIDQYNFDTNVQPQMEAERVAEEAQQKFEATGSGEFLDLAAKAAREAREIAAKEPEAPPSAVDQVLSRTKPFKDVPYALDEIEAQQLQKAEAAAKPEVVEAEAEAEAEAETETAAVEAADEEVGGDQTTPDLTPEQRREAAENAGGSGPSLEPIVKIANDPDLTPEEKSDKASNQIFTGLTGQEVNLSPKESVKAYEKMFSEMLGMKDKDAEKEMWHNMAMIGFAIAAGESPDALSNIANGLLAGTKMMKQDRASEQARKDKVKLAAMNRAFQVEDAETKFGRDLQLVGARNAATSSVGKQEPFVDAVRVLAQKGMDSGLYKTVDEALAAADAALRPYYSGSGVSPSKTKSSDQEYVVGQTYKIGETNYTYQGGDVTDKNNFKVVE
jgi:hypothetical protein